MTSMKLSMNKMLGGLRRKPTTASSADTAADPTDDSPEGVASRSVKEFCTSGGLNNGDEVTLLPPIVDAAESSPAAAAECARLTKKYMHRDYWTKPSYQYNSIMLIRILADNPGMTFTRNIDKKYVDTVRDLLAKGRDHSVRQLLMETLDSFENNKEYDESLGPLIDMWKKEKEKAYKMYGGKSQPGPRTLNAPPFDPNAQTFHSQNYFARAHSNKRLPDPIELANRLEEARTSAKLLEQVVGCTPPAEVLDNDLIKEFADRCLSASRSIQGYMTSDPSPDNDTMESLIDTNEQLQQALNQHQRAMLNARKHLGLNERSAEPSPAPPPVNERSRPDTVPAVSAPSGPPPTLPSRKPVGNGKGKAAEVWDAPGPSRSQNGTPKHGDEEEDGQDPFRDPHTESSAGSSSWKAAAGGLSEPPRLAYEPFHPGFGARQDSAVNKVHMHGVQADVGSGSKSHAPDPVTPISDDGFEGREDKYDATPKKGGINNAYRS